MQLTSLLALCVRFIPFLTLIATAALHAQSSTAIENKPITLTITGGTAPFATSGTQIVTLDPRAGRYTIDTGTTRTASGTYSFSTAFDGGAVLSLNNYFGNTVFTTLSLSGYNPTTGAGTFRTFAGTTFNQGTFVVPPTLIPVITSPTTATVSVGSPFIYQITANNLPTTFFAFSSISGIATNAASGLVTGTFNTPGTFTLTIQAQNSAGTSPNTTVAVTIIAAATVAPAITSTATGSAAVGTAYTYQITASNAPTSYAATGLPAGLAVSPTTGLISGIPTGTVGTYTVNISAANAVGSTTGRLTLTLSAAPIITLAAAPTNLVGYRTKVGQVFQFTVTGAARGAVWGSDVYTDDSSLATAAVHAGVLADGVSGTVTVTILPGQPSYAAAVRNGVSSSSWGSWAGSYSFAGVGTVGAASVATAAPTAARGFVASTTTLTTGGRLVCPVNVSGGGTYSYRWYLNGNLIAGATANPYIVESLTGANAGLYSADVTNALGTTRLTAGTVSVGSAGSPVFALQPISKSVVPGATFTLAANASGTNNAYLWFRNNVAIPGETGAILLRNNANAADAGAYTVRVSNPVGTVTSSAATVVISANASRPANISVRTNVATGTLVTPAFVLKGSGSKRMLIRAVGPGLAAFGLPGTMENPKLTVFRGSTELTTNDDWSATNIGQAFAATGAFALPANSKDAALVVDLPASPTGESYSVQVTNASGTGGIVLVEVYDADALRGTSTSLLVNVSVRGQTAPGDDVLTLGLVIGGQGPRTLLVRGIGPKLAAFGVTGTVPDPRLQIVDSQSRIILANDDWAAADFVSELALATSYVGAFALDAGSKDAATLSLVDPGAYTIQVSGTVANPTGEALVEVYEVP